MYETIESFDFPDLPDEAVIAINDFIEQIYRRFQNHYFTQMHRYDLQHRHPRDPLARQLSLPLIVPPPDPPF